MVAAFEDWNNIEEDTIPCEYPSGSDFFEDPILAYNRHIKSHKGGKE